MKAVNVLVAVASSLIVSATTAAAQTPAEFYEDQCLACHTIGGGPAIGPDLKGVTERQSREWLARFIADPDKVVESGDPYAKKLVDAADGMVMPEIDGLTPAMIEGLLDYLTAQGREGGGAPAAPPEKKFTADDVARGRAILTGRTRLADGGPACIACHSLNDLTAFGGGALGPDLTHVWARLQGQRGMRGWLSAPPTPTMRAVYGTHKLTSDEVDGLLALFESTDASTGAVGTARLPFVASGVGGAALALVAMMFVWRGRFRSVRRPLVGTGAAGGTR